MDDTEFAPEEISDFSLKDGGDDADVITEDETDPIEDPNEDKFGKAFAKEEDELYAPVDDDAVEIQNYILSELYEE
jgi:hypothetical protein